jgi:hypothetical protein
VAIKSKKCVASALGIYGKTVNATLEVTSNRTTVDFPGKLIPQVSDTPVKEEIDGLRIFQPAMHYEDSSFPEREVSLSKAEARELYEFLHNIYAKEDNQDAAK